MTLKSGLLWYAKGTAKSLRARIKQAIKHYEQKYGELPTVCQVHPATLEGEDIIVVDGVQVIGILGTLRHHFLLGCEEEEDDTAEIGA